MCVVMNVLHLTEAKNIVLQLMPVDVQVLLVGPHVQLLLAPMLILRVVVCRASLSFYKKTKRQKITAPSQVSARISTSLGSKPKRKKITGLQYT